MTEKYAIHSDFKLMKWVKLSLHPTAITAINTIFKLQRCFNFNGKDINSQTVILPVPDGGQCKIKLIRPTSLIDNAPVILYFHGGAFAFTYASLHEKALERHAQETQSLIALVDYRLTPKHPFPAAFNDCVTALEYLHKNAKTLHINPKKILLMGDSAGGALVASVAQKARDTGLEICGQLMIYPVIDHSCSTNSSTEFTDTPVWNSYNNQRMWQHYLKGYDEPPQYASPILGQVKNLAPAYIETAEFDPLRDEGIAYAKSLNAAGVETELHETKGTVHGFDAIANSTISKAAVEKRLKFIEKVFNS